MFERQDGTPQFDLMCVYISVALATASLLYTFITEGVRYSESQSDLYQSAY